MIPALPWRSAALSSSIYSPAKSITLFACLKSLESAEMEPELDPCRVQRLWGPLWGFLVPPKRGWQEPAFGRWMRCRKTKDDRSKVWAGGQIGFENLISLNLLQNSAVWYSVPPKKIFVLDTCPQVWEPRRRERRAVHLRTAWWGWAGLVSARKIQIRFLSWNEIAFIFLLISLLSNYLWN